jgi:hypothetical protein
MLFIALLCGAGAAVLRGLQLVYSFDPQTSLIKRGDLITISLVALSALFVVIAAVYAFTKRKAPPPPPRRLGRVWAAVEFSSLAVLFSASSVDIYWGFTRGRPVAVCLGFLGLFAWGGLLMLGLNINKLPFTSATGFWATVPVFWSCLMLITEFWGHAGNPVRNTYAYGILATVFCTLSLYTAAGFFFNKANLPRAMLYILPGIFFATLTLGGALLSFLLGDPPVARLSPAFMLRLGFIILHLCAVAAAILYGRFTLPEEPEEEVPEHEKEGV